MLYDPASVRLGRQPARHDVRTLKLTDYVPQLPAIPDHKNWGTAVSEWGEMLNADIGDCAIAAAGHIVLLDTSARGRASRIADADIEKAYGAVSGYVPGKDETDRGCVELDVLKYWRKIGIGGHKILGFAAIPVHNRKLLRQAIYLFGSVYAGINLPLSAQRQELWKVTNLGQGDSAPGSWGGHAVPLVAYDTVSFACITWGQPQWMTESWWLAYGDEAYAVISEDWAPPSGLAPNAFNLDQLKADLAAISKGH